MKVACFGGSVDSVSSNAAKASGVIIWGVMRRAVHHRHQNHYQIIIKIIINELPSLSLFFLLGTLRTSLDQLHPWIRQLVL